MKEFDLKKNMNNMDVARQKQPGAAQSLPPDANLSLPGFIDQGSSAKKAIGTIIDKKYEIISLLGTGGMSAVYKAKHLLMRKIVAIKLMHPRLLNEPQSLRRFQQEARAASRLSHPNAIAVHEFGIEGDQPYLVMDYLDGLSLADLIKQDGKIDAQRCLHIFVQACDALSDAHRHGIVHRDLKPGNIMLTKSNDDDCYVKVVDFGIAKIVSGGGDSLKLTSTGEVFGSPLYMSPEQCVGSVLDSRSDIYSMGCLMYEALTGAPPFIGNNVLETILKQSSEPAPGLGTINGDIRVVQKLDAIVLKCLAKAPEQRYQSMEELRHDLKLAQEADSSWKLLASFGRKLSTARRTIANKFGRRRTAILAALASSSVILAVLTTFLILITPGISTSIAERELPLKPITKENLQLPTSAEAETADKLWTKLDPDKHTSPNNFDVIDRVLKFYTSIADRYKSWGKYSEAVILYGRALILADVLHLDKSLLAADLHNSRAECELLIGGSGPLKTALSSALAAIDRLQINGKAVGPEMLLARTQLAEACYRLGDLDQAKKNYTEVRDLFFKGYYKGLGNDSIAMILARVGRFYLEQGDYGTACVFLARAEGFWSLVGEQAILNLAAVTNDLAKADDFRGLNSEAQKLYERVNRILLSQGKNNDALRSLVLMNLSDSYLKSGKWLEALKVRIAARRASLNGP